MRPLPEFAASEHDNVVNDGGFGVSVQVLVEAAAEDVEVLDELKVGSGACARLAAKLVYVEGVSPLGLAPVLK